MYFTRNFLVKILFIISFIFININTQELPSWNMPYLRPLRDFPYGGAEVLNGTEVFELFKASEEVGSYNMSPMLSYYNGMFLASWKNSPRDEDQAGQRVLYSQSVNGLNWTESNSGKRILFPNISTNANPTHLFAEPGLLLNGTVYAAASPIQFCLYPDQYQSLLLLREVKPGYDSFGPVFWSTYDIPNGYEENSKIHNILTLTDMSIEIQNDIKLLNQTRPTTYRPCDPSSTSVNHTNKCEYCENGCQNWTDVTNPTIENERTHYLLPNNSGDVILYRSKSKVPAHIYASVRNNLNSSTSWSIPAETNITDDVSNINAGNLPDGRAYFISNIMPNYIRDPLYLSITDSSNLRFVENYVLASCHMEKFFGFAGCIRRFEGHGSQPGLQYPQGLIINGDPGYLYTIFSLNKEDIYISRVSLDEL